MSSSASGALDVRDVQGLWTGHPLQHHNDPRNSNSPSLGREHHQHLPQRYNHDADAFEEDGSSTAELPATASSCLISPTAETGGAGAVPAAVAPTSTIYLAALPLELSHRDVHALVEPFGQVMSLRLCRDNPNVGRIQRAYAFVRFSTREAALAAVQELNNKPLPEHGVYLQCRPKGRSRRRKTTGAATDGREGAEETSSGDIGDNSLGPPLQKNAAPPAALAAPAHHQVNPPFGAVGGHILLHQYQQHHHHHHYPFFYHPSHHYTTTVVPTATTISAPPHVAPPQPMWAVAQAVPPLAYVALGGFTGSIPYPLAGPSLLPSQPGVLPAGLAVPMPYLGAAAAMFALPTAGTVAPSPAAFRGGVQAQAATGAIPHFSASVPPLSTPTAHF